MSVRTIYTIDVIAGDGIGLEVMPAAIACVDSLGPAFGFSVDWRHRDWGSRHYRRRGRMMPLDGIEQLATGDATLLGAVGAEDIPDDVTLWGLLIPIRREFDQYVNLRPIRVLPGVTSPLAGIDELDMVVVRENVEGESNLFGDILSDLAAAVAGSIGVAPSANLNPPRRHPSMFEPVHGSAPDIAGKGIANPVGQMWAAAMMLDHLGQPAAADALAGAFESALRAGIRTRDLGGSAGTGEFTMAVLEHCRHVDAAAAT